jgi:hypothetical protein
MRTSDKSNEERTQLRPPPYGLSAPEGLWIKVRARIRRLQEWERPEGLEIADDRMVEFASDQQGMLIEDWFDLYQPLLEPELWPEFVRLFADETPPSAPEVIRFYGRYGPLRVTAEEGKKQAPAWTQRLSERARRRLAPEAGRGLCEPLWWLQEKARELKLTYEVYAALQQGRLSELAARLGPVPEGKQIIQVSIEGDQLVRWAVDEEAEGKRQRGRASSAPVEERLSAEPSPGVASRALLQEEARHLAMQVLAGQLNQGEERGYRRWAVYQPLPLGDRRRQPWGEPSPASLALVRDQYFRDLLAAMYLLLGELVAQRSVLRVCSGCRRLFYPGRRDQVYCSKHCGDATRQRLYYRNPEAKQQPLPARKKKRPARRRRA